MTERNLEGIQIYETRRTYSKTESGYWRRRPDHEQVLMPITHRMYIDGSQKIFRSDRVEYGYTYAGYIPVKLTTYSPDGKHKMVFTWRQALITA